MSTIWYLWPVDNDPVTNEYFAKGIGEQNPECERRDVLCADGKKRNLFSCPKGYADVRTAAAAISKFNLKFEVYKEEGESLATDLPTRFDLWKKSVRNSARTAAMLSNFRNNR